MGTTVNLSLTIAAFFYSSDYQKLSHNKKVDLFGQYVAKFYLQAKGYEVLAENYYVRAGELDLVVRKKEHIHIIEIKTRLQERRVPVQTAIHYFKQLSLRRSAALFMSDKGWLYNKFYQIDGLVVIISKKEKKVRVRHYRNIIEDNGY